MYAAFFVNGLSLAVWIVNIPQIVRRTGISNGMLGGLLLVLGAGAVLGMQGSGLLASRVGSRAAVGVGAGVLAVGTVLPAFAHTPLELGAALAVLGLGNGCIDVAMNDQGVAVQNAYGRPILSSFHALFSVGGACGAGLGALVQAQGGGVLASMGPTAVASLLAGAGLVPFLLSHEAVHGGLDGAVDTMTRETAPGVPSRGRHGLLRTALALGAMATAFMLTEGIANDWSAVHAVQHLHRTGAAAAAPYVVFATAMTTGRLVIDRVTAAVGPVRVVRVGSTIAILGLLAVVAVPAYAVVLVGWAVFGIGLAGIIPQLFTAAGSLVPGPRGAIMLSRIVGAGYVGSLAGPAVIGWVSEATGINAALLIPVALCALGLALAGATRGGVRAESVG